MELKKISFKIEQQNAPRLDAGMNGILAQGDYKGDGMSPFPP
jgi:hypothetical protein